MAKLGLIVSAAVSIFVLAGCTSVETSRTQAGAVSEPTTEVAKAGKAVEDVNTLYDEAVRTEESGQFLLLKDESRLRQALDKYNKLITKYPTSDKIDDAAFRAAGIYEHLGDYKLALLYYQRTYQWDPETTYPARYKAAFILDRQFHQRDEALRLYKDALQRITRSNEHRLWQQLAEQRVRELSGESKPGQ